MRGLTTSVVFLLLILFTQHGNADVLGSSASGFLVKSEATVSGTPDKVFNALVSDIARWWDSDHTFSGDSRNLTLEAKAGGCFCEALPNGGSVRHLEVVFVSPGKTLRLTGALGPLQGSGLAGSMTWSLQADGDSTRVELGYGVGGYYQEGVQEIAPVVDSVVRDQRRESQSGDRRWKSQGTKIRE
jgi:uncharacterized protein YndB with AHSA1/START domain